MLSHRLLSLGACRKPKYLTKHVKQKGLNFLLSMFRFDEIIIGVHWA